MYTWYCLTCTRRHIGLGCRRLLQVTNETIQCHKLAGTATDWASANIAGGGLNGLVEQKLTWIFWMWCLAHRIELPIKDALTGTVFDAIDEMFLRLYGLYERFPRELEEIINDLKQCL